MILRRLATFPARLRPFAKLTALERVDTEKTEIGCNRVAIERPGRRGETRLAEGGALDVAGRDKEDETQKAVHPISMTKGADLYHCVDRKDQSAGNQPSVGVRASARLSNSAMSAMVQIFRDPRARSA